MRGPSQDPPPEIEALRVTNLALRDSLQGHLVLRDIARRILSQTEPAEIASELAQSSREVSGARQVGVYLSEGRERGFALAAVRPEAPPALPAALSVPPDLLLWILRERKGTTLPAGGGNGARTILPLHSARACEGMLEVHLPAGVEAPTEEVFEKLQTLASAAAAAIRNARLQESFVQASTYLSNILDSVNHGILVCDTAGRVTRVNQNFLVMFDLGDAVLAGGALSEILSENLRVVFQELAADAEREGIALDRLVERTDPSGNEMALGVSATFLRDAAGRRIGLIYLCRDMTASRELDRLRRLSQLKSEFVNNVSHELRTPLTSIKAYTEALVEMVEGNATAKKFLGVISTESDRLLEMIENLLNVSRIESGKFRLHREVVNPNDVLDAALSVAKVQMTRHAFEAQVASGLPPMSLDANKVKEVLLNLLSNAVKYSPGGGRIRLEAALAEGNLRISVADSGIGISPENVKRLFEPFFRVESEATAGIRGTGLGLTITRKIVEAHGGTIRVESALGKGSTFTMFLPVSEQARDEEIRLGGVSDSPFA